VPVHHPLNVFLTVILRVESVAKLFLPSSSSLLFIGEEGLPVYSSYIIHPNYISIDVSAIILVHVDYFGSVGKNKN